MSRTPAGPGTAPVGRGAVSGILLDPAVGWWRRFNTLFWLPVLIFGLFWSEPRGHGPLPLVVIGLTLATLGWVATSLRVLSPRWVEPAAAVLLAAGGCILLHGEGHWSTASAFPLLAAHLSGIRAPLRRAVVITVLTGVAMTLVLPHDELWQPLIVAFALMAALLLGLVRRDAARRAVEREESLVAQARARAEHARADAIAERARIARDVHDVLAHSLSALAVQLQGARLMALRDGAAADTIAQIERAQGLATEGLAEARRAVGALRNGPADLAEGLRALVAEHPGATAEIDEVPGPGPRRAETVLRTAQEALSNVRKHAPGAPVHVRLRHEDGHTELDVTDVTGEPAPGRPPDQGYGLIGMAERAELIGARLEAGPTADGWRVTLRLAGQDRDPATADGEGDR